MAMKSYLQYCGIFLRNPISIDVEIFSIVWFISKFLIERALNIYTDTSNGVLVKITLKPLLQHDLNT